MEERKRAQRFSQQACFSQGENILLVGLHAWWGKTEKQTNKQTIWEAPCWEILVFGGIFHRVSAI